MEDDAIILLGAASGKPGAVASCIDRFGPLVWSLARKMLVNAHDAEDAVQEVFIELWKAAPKFDPSIASAQTFVAMIARRRIIDRGRAQRRHSRHSAPPDFAWERPAPDAVIPADDDAAKAIAAVAQLRPEQQQAIRLAIGQGWSHQEIADRLGVPLGTVKTNLRRGLIRLRELVSGSVSSPEGAAA